MSKKYPKLDSTGLPIPFNAIGNINSNIKTMGAAITINTDRGPQTMYLVVTRVRSNLLEDFLNAFGSELEQLVEKVIGNKIEWHDFGVLYDSELRMIFAFNMKLAGYDPQTCQVVYKEPQQVLAELIEKYAKTVELTNVPPVELPTQSGGGFGRRQRIVFRYAIVDPKQSTTDKG